MSARSTAVIPLAALVGCTLLTDIPDDVSAGDPATAADGAARRDAAGGGGTDASNADGAIPSTDGASPAAGTVTLDAIAPGFEGAGGKGKTSPLLWSHTTSGVNRALFVSVTIDADPDSTVVVGSVKYESAALTLVGLQHSNNKDAGYTTLWALANPAAGTHSVSVEFSGNPQPILAGSISFQGVDQTTPFQNVTKTGGTGNKALASVTSATKHMVIGSIVGACTIAPPDGAQGWLRNVTCGDGGGNGAQSAVAGAPNVDLVYGIEGDWWGIVAADIKPAASP